jgi:hypothetical protein
MMNTEELTPNAEKIRARLEELTAMVSQACAELRDATDSFVKASKAGEIW